MDSEKKMRGLSRRQFLAGAAGVGAMAALGMAGCAPSTSTGGSSSATSTSTKTSASGATADWLGTAPDIASSKIAETRDTDLLIVGAGNGGMAAAAYAATNGVKFEVCEISDAVGPTRHWFAAVGTEPFTSQGITVDRARLLGEIIRYSSGMCNQSLIRMWMDESNDMFKFIDPIMTAAGAKVVADEFEMPGGMGGTSFYTPPMEHHYIDATTGQRFSTSRNELFQKVVESKGGSVNFKHELAKLVREDGPDGRVTGAIFKTGDDSYVQINAKKAVLLTTGGYQGNPDMLSALSPVTTASVTAMGFNEYNKGAGQKAAMWAGAVRDYASATMIFDRGLVKPGTTAGYTASSIDAGAPQFPSSGQFNPGTQPFLKVNMKGERFANESADYDYLPHAASMQPGGVYASIWDSSFGDDVQRFHTLGCSASTRMGVLAVKKDDGTYDLDKYFEKELADGRLQKADTIDALADKLGFTGEVKKTFLATVERYNALYDQQEDTDFGKEAYRLSSISKAPFYGATLGGTLLTTIDGIRINADCQALGEDHEPIEGLYVAGDCSGSVFSGNYPDQLHGFACGRTMTEAIHVVKLAMKM